MPLSRAQVLNSASPRSEATTNEALRYLSSGIYIRCITPYLPLRYAYLLVFPGHQAKYFRIYILIATYIKNLRILILPGFQYIKSMLINSPVTLSAFED